MHVYKRCSCSASCRHPWWFRFRLHGREHRASTRTANRQLAERIAGKKQTEALEDVEGIRKRRAPPLSAYIRDYMKWAQQAHSTHVKDQQVLDRLLEFLGDKRLDQITTFDVERWKTARAGDVAKTTVNRELNVVRGCFSRAVEWKHLRQSPCDGVAPFKVDDVRIRVLNEDELHTVLTGAPADIALMCRVTLESLLRINEVVQLRKEDIGAIWVQVRRKGGRVQKVQVSPGLKTALLKRAHKSGWVFGKDDNDGKPPTREAASVAVCRAMTALGIEGASHHTLRHTGITLLLEAGINPRAIQKLAGWTESTGLRMLQRYGHVRDAEISRAVSVTAAIVERAQTRAQQDPKPEEKITASS
jgi:integrase